MMATRTIARVEPSGGVADGEMICIDTYEISTDVTLTVRDNYDNEKIVNLTPAEARTLASALAAAVDSADPPVVVPR